ncbi:unnamed protein product [Nesidiocoris tenuis]|uniref:Uncharacterized protein n=1 Tax=Nesidiocoris tenuis TaxID=355587 RepID=A0A6H5GU53_9HEMI|nr:unnamed protein product [Nesidiocoris tenuis]
MKEYHDLYLKTDVILLADVFEQFREMSMKFYSIDPCNCYSCPNLSWNAFLKMTNVKLELLTDIDQHLFVESAVRGGVSMIPHRYAKANNPYLKEFDPNQPRRYLQLLDANNLYGFSLATTLPKGSFRWLNEEEVETLDVIMIPDDNDTGYILEVDLEYPKELHDLHSDYPLAPERQSITHEMLPPQFRNYVSKSVCSVPKLVTTLNDKVKYILHYRMAPIAVNSNTQDLVKINISKNGQRYKENHSSRLKVGDNVRIIVSMDPINEDLVHRIDIIKSNIRDKYNTLRGQKNFEERTFKQQFEPILSPLKTIAEQANVVKKEGSDTIDFTHPQSIGRLLGFSPTLLKPNVDNYSDVPVNINKVDIIRIYCNIARGAFYNGVEDHIIHEFYPAVMPGFKIIEIPKNVIYLPINTRTIHNITVSLRDQDGRLINFRGESINVRLHLRNASDNGPSFQRG